MDIVKKTARAAAAIGIAAAFMMPDLFGATEFDTVGTVESVRRDSVIIMLFEKAPRTGTYYVIDGGTVFATVEVKATEYVRTGTKRFRIVATYTLTNEMYADMIRAGTDIGIPKGSGQTGREFGDAGRFIEKGPRSTIVCRKDGKEMVLVPEGKFVFGANDGERDESPEQVVFVHDFYIDRYEVSNEEYARFIEASGVRPPLSWKEGGFPEGEGALPVAVTYHEAEAYARWAGKRLPTEEEWEKAARGRGNLPGEGGGNTYRYPWGVAFNPEKANCAEFWAEEQTGAHIKTRFQIAVGGLMPITAFDPEGASPFGAVNMAGNAREWTSSWYMPYRGNTSKQGKEYRMYGRQYKVVRGGAWYSTRHRLRVSSREVGGVPSLHADNLAGFRCVKEPDILDARGD